MTIFQEIKVSDDKNEYDVHFKSNAHTTKNQSNLFIQVNFYITSFNVVPTGFDDTFPAIGKLFDAIK